MKSIFSPSFSADNVRRVLSVVGVGILPSHNQCDSPQHCHRSLQPKIYRGSYVISLKVKKNYKGNGVTKKYFDLLKILLSRMNDSRFFWFVFRNKEVDAKKCCTSSSYCFIIFPLTQVMKKGLSIWRYNRYHVIVEYMNRSTSPTPFCIIVHLFLALKWLLRTCYNALKNPTNRVSKKSDQLKNFNSKLRYDIEKLNMADKVRLSQFQSNRAVCIMREEKLRKEHIPCIYHIS